LRGFFADTLITEHGGSFLNSGQKAVRGLAATLGLKQEVVNGGDLREAKRCSSSTVARTAIRRPTPTGWTARTSARRAGSAS
jgi:hypothetical protein